MRIPYQPRYDMTFIVDWVFGSVVSVSHHHNRVIYGRPEIMSILHRKDLDHTTEKK